MPLASTDIYTGVHTPTQEQIHTENNISMSLTMYQLCKAAERAACDPSTKTAQAPSAVGVGSEVSLGILCAAQSPCNPGTSRDADEGVKGVIERP